MHKTIKEDWIRTLRSGSINVGRFYLATLTNNVWQFSVFGVLVEMYQTATRAGGTGYAPLVEGFRDISFPGGRLIATYNTGWSVPPSPVLHWAGLGGQRLYNLHDISDAGNFKEAAQWIEKYL